MTCLLCHEGEELTFRKKISRSLSLFNLDQNFPATIKDEKQERHVECYLKSDLTETTTLDQPLLIVLDEDDGNLSEENPTINTNSINKNELSQSSSEQRHPHGKCRQFSIF